MYGHPLRLAENNRTSVKAAIKRASQAGRTKMRKLDKDLLAQLEGVYRQAADDIRAYLIARAGDENTLRIEVMQELLTQAESRLNKLASERNGLLETGLIKAADIGVEPFSGALDVGASLTKIADDAARFVTQFTAEDGLQLSQRIWNLDAQAREVVAGRIQQAVVRGWSATKAAQEFINAGLAVPRDVSAQIGEAAGTRIGKDVWDGIMNGSGSPMDNAMRVFRTEINRAHGEAYQAAAFEHPDAIGTRFLLSPNHPRVDICDMHAKVNRYGLGPGVYPKGKNPWPAHPNTLSFTEVVFSDEVTDEDRAGKEDRISWLKRQSAATQEGVLGGVKKRQAFQRELITENQIGSTWRSIEKRLKRKGIDPSLWDQPTPTLPPVEPTPGAKVPTETIQAKTWAPAWNGADPRVLQVINRYPAPNPLPSEPGSGAYHYHGSIMMGKANSPKTGDGRRGWRHEYGHYIDFRLRPNDRQFYASDSAAGRETVKADARLWKDRRMLAFNKYRGYNKAVRESYKGRRFGEQAFKELRYEVHDKEFMRMAQEVMDEIPALKVEIGSPEFYRKLGDMKEQLVVRAESYFSERDDIYARMWSILEPMQKKQLAVGYLTAEKFDDLAFLVDNIGSRHDSYVNMMDLVGSITLNKTGRGHSLKYYKDFSHRQAAEAFANTFDLLSYGPGGLEDQVLDIFAPNFKKYVLELIK